MDQNLLKTVSAHLNQGNFSKALNLLGASENNYSHDAQYWETLALTQGMSGNNDGCKNSCLKAIKLNPNNIGTYINLGVAQQNLGLLNEAQESLNKALNIDRSHPQVQNNMGAIHILKSEYSLAKPYIVKAISLQPNYSEAHSNLGEIFKHFHDNDKAINSYLKSIELNANNINAHIGLGTLYSFQALYDMAENYLNYAIKLNPYHSVALFNLGFLNYLKKSYKEAANYFKDTLAVDPDHHNAAYLLSAITNKKNPNQSPTTYIKDLFDYYADNFDDHLVKSLEYKVPGLMYSTFNKYAKPSKTGYLLDLGCGTGIIGENFHTSHEHLTGIDLSENMLKKAKEKNIYNELHNQEISEYLKNNNFKYDLVIASDVFIYIGNISELVKLINNNQSNSGYFIFSIEKSFNHETFNLRSTGRYSHNTSYIERIISNAAYRIIKSFATVIRKENGEDIDGYIYLCQKEHSSLN